MRGPVRIEEVRQSSEMVLTAVADLVEQLSKSAGRPTPGENKQVISSDASRLLIARDEDGLILGMLTLVLFRIPTGVRAWIEDVVVEDAARGAGVGRRLVGEAVTTAQAAGARTVDLTSRSDRKAANALYSAEGFELRCSNLYRRTL
jgi:ribosomal protein S18 acetylase RimI-like enzyme